jgi:hypothetical protein
MFTETEPEEPGGLPKFEPQIHTDNADDSFGLYLCASVSIRG